MVRLAADSFTRVALYFENSILPEDWPYLGAAEASVSRVAEANGKLTIDSRHGAGIRWRGAARVDGRLWPVGDGETLWLPPGKHTMERADEIPPTRLIDLNAELKNAWSHGDGVEFEYQSGVHALATFDHQPIHIEVDGAVLHPESLAAGPGRFVISLPAGQHLVRVETEPK